MKKIQLLCTLGPASLNKKVISRLDEIGIDVFRLNLSHIDIDQIEEMILKIRKYSNIPICLDSEGAQVRTGKMNGKVPVKEGDIVTIHSKSVLGEKNEFSLTPETVVKQLREGDLISVDYDTALLRVIARKRNQVEAIALYDGYILSNKGVSVCNRKIELDPLTKKDKAIIKKGMKLGIKHVALSFANRKSDVQEIRKLCDKDVFVMSKVESHQGLINLEEITEASDAILIDRGDLSKEESIVNIPFLQKMVIKNANRLKTQVYVATNLLESMIDKRSPTRAEVNDVINTLMDGADGLVLAAETAIGQHPVGSANTIKSLIRQYRFYQNKGMALDSYWNEPNYLLVPPHGGLLINRMDIQEDKVINSMKWDHKLVVDDTILIDVEQIANGTYSPLEGFMNKKELASVLDKYSLPSGDVWTMPIILQKPLKEIQKIQKGDRVALVNKKDKKIYGELHVSEIFSLKIDEVAVKWFETNDESHPGVSNLKKGGEYCLAGKVKLLRKRKFDHCDYSLTPKEVRTIFEHKGWTKVIGFHTRNVIHRAHEYIQMEALSKSFADGLFVHPLIGPKKKNDFTPGMIVKAYRMMIQKFYPKGKVFFSVFSSYPRYAGPREAVFTALCRKNYGCTHFIVGRDHSGVGDFYAPDGAKQLFKKLGGIGIKSICFDQVHYCASCKKYVEKCEHGDQFVKKISGSKVREMFLKGKKPPRWLMRSKISQMIKESIRKGLKVFE